MTCIQPAMDSFDLVKTSFSLVGHLASKLSARLDKTQAHLPKMTSMFTNTDSMNKIAAWLPMSLTLLLCEICKTTFIEFQALTWKKLVCTSDRIRCSRCKIANVKRKVKDPYMKARNKSFSWFNSSKYSSQELVL